MVMPRLRSIPVGSLLGRIAYAHTIIACCGVVYRFELQNGRWVAERRATFGQPLNALTVAPDGTIWVVGEDGLIAHSLPRNQWSLSQPIAGVSLHAIQILGNDQVRWVGGTLSRPGTEGEPVMLRGTGETWTHDMDVGGEGQIDSLHFVADGGWAVGGNHIWRYAQGRWQAEQVPQPCDDVGCAGGFGGVRAISTDEAWAVGSRIGLLAMAGYCWPMAMGRRAKEQGTKEQNREPIRVGYDILSEANGLRCFAQHDDCLSLI